MNFSRAVGERRSFRARNLNLFLNLCKLMLLMHFKSLFHNVFSSYFPNENRNAFFSLWREKNAKESSDVAITPKSFVRRKSLIHLRIAKNLINLMFFVVVISRIRLINVLEIVSVHPEEAAA